MLRKIGIKNFKSFGDIEYIELSKLTLLSGVNSSGKSSVYQAILIILQSYNETKNYLGSEVPMLKVNGPYLEIGKPSELLNNIADEEVFLSFESDQGYAELTFFLHREDYGKDTFEYILLKRMFYRASPEHSIEAEMNTATGEWKIKAEKFVHFADYSEGRFIDYMITNLLAKAGKNVRPSGVFSSVVEFSDVRNVKFKNFMLLSFDLNIESLEDCLSEEYKKAFTKKGVVANNLRKINEPKFGDYVQLHNSIDVDFIPEIEVDKIIVIPPFRGEPHRIYSDGGFNNPLEDYIRKKNNKIDSYFDFSKNEIVQQTLEESLNYWVNFFKIAKTIDIRSIASGLTSEIILVLDGKELSINNMGYGLSQILPVIFRVLSSDRSETCIVDEPEIHLHPSAQSKLADFFGQMSLLGKVVLIETHSESLLSKLVYFNVKYPQLFEEVKMLWVERIDGKAVARKIEHDNMGYIINPPDGFMDERDKLIDDLTKLRLEKIEAGEV